MLKLIPFNPQWLSHETLDVHAIYRRPKRTHTGEIIRDEDGFVVWDLTGPLPVRSHNKWSAKGFRYITLADRTDVVSVSDPELATRGVDPLIGAEEYLGQDGRARGGPWHAPTYLDDLRAQRDTRATNLRRRIDQNGPDAAEEFEQQADPDYRLPAALRDTRPVAPSAEAPAPDPPKRRGRPRKQEAAA